MAFYILAYFRRNIFSHPNYFIITRNISNSEIATALRPFYFVVHPDLFGQHPQQRTVNEESLKHLSAYLESIQKKRYEQNLPKILQFYIRSGESTKNRDTFKLIRISLDRNSNLKEVIRRILQSCNISTDYIDKVKSTSVQENISKFNNVNETAKSSPFDDFDSVFNNFTQQFYRQKEEQKKDLRDWLYDNFELAHKRKKNIENLQEEVNKLQNSLAKRLEVKEIRFDCGWNLEHYRGSLKTLERLADLHYKDMHAIKNRIIVFASFTGISREGHVMLYTGDVPYSWIDFIKNIGKHDVYLKRIPAYEVALSQVLLNIQVGRRKFMPKSQAMQYAGYLRKVTTTLLDYLTTHKYPKSWPNDLREYKIVIESESGPLMVSPTGQIIAPATCPGTILVDFLTNNLCEAREKTIQYNKNKHIERKLHDLCMKNLQLKALTKDDSVYPEKMIQTLEKLYTSNLNNFKNIHLHIGNYYSVLSDGTMVIPWDFDL